MHLLQTRMRYGSEPARMLRDTTRAREYHTATKRGAAGAPPSA